MGLEACQAAYEYGEEWLTQLKEYLKDNISFVREFIQTRLPKLTMIEPEVLTFYGLIFVRLV